MPSGSQARRILVYAAVLLAGWSLVLRALPWRAHLAESNYESNLIRLQQALLGPRPAVALVGSSITGRLLPEYFSGTTLGRVGNLGLDGSGPVLGLELLANRTDAELPPVIVIEANLLMVPEADNDRVLREAVKGFGFRLAGHLPLLRAETRPTSLVYAWMKHRKDSRSEKASPMVEAPSGTNTMLNAPQAVRLDRNSPAELAAHKERVYALCRRLQTRGVRLLLVRFPTATMIEQTEFHPLDFTADLARELAVPRLDLGALLRRRGQEPHFTDGTHLTTTAARQAAVVIAEAVPSRP